MISTNLSFSEGIMRIIGTNTPKKLSPPKCQVDTLKPTFDTFYFLSNLKIQGRIVPKMICPIDGNLSYCSRLSIV